MKNRKYRKIFKHLILLIAGLVPLLGSVPVWAASASISLSSAGSVVKGSYITVSIRENSGAEPVNAAKATLNYPADKLAYVSISSSSAFGIVAASSGGGGSVSVDRGALPAVSGSQTVASVTFKALTDSGTAAVSIASGSVLSANDSSELYSGGSGTNIALKPVPVVAPPPPQDTIPPKITGLKVSDITPLSAVINWTTSEPASSEVDYGLTKSYGLVTSDANLVTDHKIMLNSALIAPGSDYHYLVKSADAAGNAVSSADGAFSTQGAKVQVTVLNQNNKAVKGAKVSLLESAATTDKSGVGLISGAMVGKQTLLINFKGRTYSKIITVNQPDAKNTPQLVKAQIKTTSGIILPIVLAGLIIVAALAWLVKKNGGLPPVIRDQISKILPRKQQPPATAAPISSPVIKPTKVN